MVLCTEARLVTKLLQPNFTIYYLGEICFLTKIDFRFTYGHKIIGTKQQVSVISFDYTMEL